MGDVAAPQRLVAFKDQPNLFVNMGGLASVAREQGFEPRRDYRLRTRLRGGEERLRESDS